MVNMASEDDQTIADIHKWLPFVKQKSDNLIRESSAAGTLLNANSLKSLVQQSLPNNAGSSVQLTVEWVCFLNSYLRQIDYTTISSEAKSLWQYVVSLCVSFFGKANLRVLYSCPELVDLFNEFITHFVHLNSDLTSKCLLDMAKDYLKLSTGCLNYLEYLAVDRLSAEKRFQDIVALCTGPGEGAGSLLEFASIDASSLTRKRVLRLFVNCAKSLFVAHQYRAAHETLEIVFNLPVTLSQDGEISEIVSVYVLTVILLDKKQCNVDPYLIKFASAVPPNLLKMFQCYYSCRFEQFVRLILLEYTQRSEAFGEEEYLFTKRVVARLLGNMCRKKNAGILGKRENVSGDELKRVDAVCRLDPVVRPLGIDIRAEKYYQSGLSANEIQDELQELVRWNGELSKQRRD